MHQICNLVYFTLIEGKTSAEIAELNVSLSDPKEKEEMLARQNAEAMKQLQQMGGIGMIGPPRPARDRRTKP